MDNPPEKYFASVWEFIWTATGLGSKQVIGDSSEPKFADAELRVNLVFEETQEFIKACGFEIYLDLGGGGYKLSKTGESNFIEAIDGLCDLLYVIFGTFIAWGVAPQHAFAEVHRSNMTKLGRGVKVREDGKILKSPEYQPPQLERVLHEQIARCKQG